MYLLPEMIDLGLKTNQKWPTPAHKQVAQTIGLCNSRVTTRDALTEVVQAIRKVPKSKIKKVTVLDLAKDYDVPYISLS